jgi:hypothetical protein
MSLNSAVSSIATGNLEPFRNGLQSDVSGLGL